MKFQINSRTLANVLGNQLRVVNAKNALAILDNFKLEGWINPSDGVAQLKVVASDAEITSEVNIALENSQNEDFESGTCCIDARKITDLVRKFNDMQLSFETQGNEAKITCGKGKYSLPIVSSNEYPIRPIEEEGFFTIPTTTLIEGLNVTKGAVSTESIRPILCGILINIKEDGIDFVATDTHKLVISNFEGQHEPKSVTIPSKTAGLLLSHFAKYNDVEVNIGANNITFKADGTLLTSSFPKGAFPNYNRVIPQDATYKAKINRKELLDAINRVSGFASNSSGLIVLEDGGMMEVKISARDLDFGQCGEEYVMCEGFPQGFKIGLNAEYFTQVLGIFTQDEVTLQLSDPSRPVKIQEEGVMAIQMPMQVIE